jgi:tetratricopeptide (TPR) repeat protein
MSRQDRRKSKRKAQKAPDHSQRMNHLKVKALSQVAHRAWAANQRHKTIALLCEAARREPTNIAVLLQLAQAYGKQRDYDNAEALLTRVLELAPRKASVHRQAAETYAAIDRPERAIACYRRCVELSRDKTHSAPALVDLARLHERRHELDAARAAIDEALKLDAENEEALLQQAELMRRAGETEQAESTLQRLAEDAARNWATRAQAWYDLAQMFDQADRYDEAFQALLAAKRLVSPHASSARREQQTSFLKNVELMQQLDAGCYERWKAAAAEDSPYRFAVLTGHPRSGTTLVEQVLDSHDEAISADEFDVITHWIYLPIVSRFPFSHSITSILDKVPAAVRQQARATYWRQTEAIFDEPIGDRLLIDKNPAMTPLLPIVNWAFPEMKMLVALRDPRDVILSCFMQKLKPNPISVNWLTLPDAADYYAWTMQSWLVTRQHTTSPWLEFRYEDVVADLAGQARRILEFLGLPWDDKVLRFYDHAREKLVRSPTYQDVTQPVYNRAVGRWQHYARYIEPVMDKLGPCLKEFGYSE